MSKPPDAPLTRKEYEEFIYTIRENYPAIEASTLVVIMISSESAEMSGEILFVDNIRLKVTEVLDFGEQRIEAYGYTVYRGEEKLYWYDSQPHPNNPSLASTNPHHKHVPPDIKHNRVPAPGLSFTQPNLPFLIKEIISLVMPNESPYKKV